VSLFGRASDKESLLLKLAHTPDMLTAFATPLPPTPSPPTTSPSATTDTASVALTPPATSTASLSAAVPAHVLQAFAQRLVGATAYFEWPALRECVVVYVTDGQYKWQKHKYLSKLANSKGSEFVLSSGGSAGAGAEGKEKDSRAMVVIASNASEEEAEEDGEEMKSSSSESTNTSSSNASGSATPRVVLVQEELSGVDKSKLQYIAEVERRSTYFEGATDVSDFKIFVAVRPFIRVQRVASSSAGAPPVLRKVYSDFTTHVPLQLLVVKNPVPDSRTLVLPLVLLSCSLLMAPSPLSLSSSFACVLRIRPAHSACRGTRECSAARRSSCDLHSA
jgi:hypothetical protein